MDAARWKIVKESYWTIAALPPSDRASRLDEIPDDIASLVQKMLLADDVESDFLDPTFLTNGLLPQDQNTILSIPGYQIIREIGSGGMGSIYLAERAADGFRHQVAIKLIKTGMDSAAVIKRFLAERQILSELDHPNIARLIDGGTMTDGRPYFVMEFVDGVEIREFCSQDHLSLDRRLRLFLTVCSAVSSAHSQLVVHRDIKPTNILVTKSGEPKLLDFGIAKIIEPQLLFSGEDTATQFRPLTPEYASPEQMKGKITGTSTDVYSLGVVLYELIAGKRPYTADEITKITFSDDDLEPPKPSAIGSISFSFDKNATDNIEPRETNGNANNTRRGLSPDELRTVRGDLDNIVLRAIRHDQERRYRSVQEFADDIERYLAGLPVKATADSRSYRFGKFIKRHRNAAAATVLGALILISSTGITGWQYLAARREKAEAERHFNSVKKIANTVMFDYYDGIKELPGTIELRRRLISDSLAYLDELAASGTDDVELKRNIVKGYMRLGEIQFGLANGNLGDSGGSLESYKKALTLAQNIAENSTENDDDLLMLGEIYGRYAGAVGQTGDIKSDIQFKLKAISILSELSAKRPDLTDLKMRIARDRMFLAMPLTISGDDAAALTHLASAEKSFAELLAAETNNAVYKRNLASSYFYQSVIFERQIDLDAAMNAAQNSLKLNVEKSKLAPGSPQSDYDIALSTARIGEVLIAGGKIKDAVEQLTNAVEIFVGVVEREPANSYYSDQLARCRYHLARAFAADGKFDLARMEIDRAISSALKTVERDPSDVFSKIDLAKFYLESGKIAAKTDQDGSCSDLSKSSVLWNEIEKNGQMPKFEAAKKDETAKLLAACQ